MNHFHMDPISPLLPVCPIKLKSALHVAYPSLVLLLIFMALVSLVFGLITLFKFNSLKVFKRYAMAPLSSHDCGYPSHPVAIVHRDEISNSFWVILYGIWLAKDIILTVKYGVGLSKNEILANVLAVFAAIAEGVGSLCLSLALLHQIRWKSTSKLLMAEEASKVGVLVHHDSPTSTTHSSRSFVTDTLNSSIHASSSSYEAQWDGPQPPRDFRSPPPPVASRVYVSETTPFFMRGTPNKSTMKKVLLFVCSWEVLFFTLLVSFIVLTFVSSTTDSLPLFYATSALYIALHLPQLVLVIIICLNHVASSFDAQETLGPRFSSRLILFAAVILNLLLAVPIYAWSLALGKFGCVAYVASGVDLVVALGALSYTLFFIFIILEFRRNVEVCLWGTALHASNTP